MGTVLLLAAFAVLSSPEVLLAVAAAIVLHEAGHWLALRCMGCGVSMPRLTALGLEMRPRGPLSYGRELLALLAGPLANGLFFVLLGLLGRRWEEAYLFAGAQLVLGVFNLLPVWGLDGGSILWILAALASDPDRADRVLRWVSGAAATLLVLGSAVLVCRLHGGGFLLWAALGLLFGVAGQIGLVKPAGRR